MKLPFLSLLFAAGLTVGSANVLAQDYGVSVRMSGYSYSDANYAFAWPSFLVTNLSSPGIEITNFSMDDGLGTSGGLWDYVANESASAGVAYTLTQGDRINNSGWGSQIAYSFTGLDAGGYMQFSVDPDTYHAGEGNVVDARPFVFNGGTVTANFSNGAALTLTWSNPAALSLSPLPRTDLPETDPRNIYYEMSQTVAAPVPEADSLALLLIGFGLIGFGARRGHSIAA